MSTSFQNAETPPPLSCGSPFLTQKPSVPSVIRPLVGLIDHVTTTRVHDVYAPVMLFGVLHAVRVAMAWAALRKGKSGTLGNASRRGRGVGEGMFGYLVLAWGGGTAASLLMSQPPTWLTSPTPWLIYPLIYLLLIPTGMATYFISTCPPLLLSMIGSTIDALARGVTISALPTALSSSRHPGSWLTPLLLSAIATCAGGWIVQTLGLAEDEWRLGVPSVLRGGMMGTLDVWGAMLVGLAHGALRGSHAEFVPMTSWLRGVVPGQLQMLGGGTERTAMVDSGVARALAVLLLGSLFSLRIAVNAFSAGREKAGTQEGSTAVDAFRAKTEKAMTTTTTTTETPRKISGSKGDGVVNISASKTREKAGTPRKDGVEVEVVKSPSSARKQRGGTPSKSPRLRASDRDR